MNGRVLRFLRDFLGLGSAAGPSFSGLSRLTIPRYTLRKPDLNTSIFMVGATHTPQRADTRREREREARRIGPGMTDYFRLGTPHGTISSLSLTAHASARPGYLFHPSIDLAISLPFLGGTVNRRRVKNICYITC